MSIVVPGKEKIPLVLDQGGTLRIGQTRVSLESVAYAFEGGDTPEAIQESYPSLNLGDIYLVIGYCLKHPEEVTEYLARQQQIFEDARNEAESRFQQQGLRDRLLQRKARRKSA